MTAHAALERAPPITEGEFALIKDLIYRESGIHLGAGKASLLVARLGRRLRDLGLESFGDYYERVIGGDDDELVKMLERSTSPGEARGRSNPPGASLRAI